MSSPFASSLVCVLIFQIVLVADRQAEAQGTRIVSPRNGFTTMQTQQVSGTAPRTVTRAMLIVNGIPQDIPVQNGVFSVRIVVAPGINVLELQAGAERDRTSLYAAVPSRDIKIVLTWDNARYVDLWVIDPEGEKCYWAHTSTRSGGNITANDETGFGPQIFTMSKALYGHYSIQAQYYDPGTAAVSRIKLYIILYEGTSKEKRETHHFIMTKPHQVYHITDLHIDPDM